MEGGNPAFTFLLNDSFSNDIMGQISTSSLMLNQDGSTYHLHLRPEHLTDNIITVGDPARVSMVSEHFDTIEAKVKNREFLTHIGTYKDQPIMVISSGIGTSNVEILLNELDALANIDLEKRIPKDNHRKLNIIRIGTSGSFQSDIPEDSHIVSLYGAGMDSLMSFYNLELSAFEEKIARQLKIETELPFQPYFVKGSEYLKNKVVMNMDSGNTVTCPGFYAPQGRMLRLPPKLPKYLNNLIHFDYEGIQFTNFEMETAAYYALGRLLGHEVLSTNAVIANRLNETLSKDPEILINSLIVKILDGFN